MIRLSGSVKFFWALASGSAEGGAAFGPGFLRPSASRFSAASASALSLAAAAAFASASRSALAVRILSARRFLSATHSGISSPVLSRPCSLSSSASAASAALSLGDLRFQLGGAIVHALVAHRLVLRRVGLDLGAIERDMPELHQAGLLAQLQNLHEQFAKRLQVPLAKIRDGAEIRPNAIAHSSSDSSISCGLACSAYGVG